MDEDPEKSAFINHLEKASDSTREHPRVDAKFADDVRTAKFGLKKQLRRVKSGSVIHVRHQ
jgi:hypothetical protein